MALEENILGYNIRDIFERNKCDPEKFNITFCGDYNRVECPKTCDYAKKLEEKYGQE